MKKLAVLAGASLALACASQKAEAPKQAEVLDVDYGRLAPNQTAMVEAARRSEMAARDDLARAQVRVRQAEHEMELAQAEAPAVEADRKRAEAEAKMASESREPTAVERAGTAKQAADLHERAAKAHADYAERLKEACAAEMTAAQRRLDASTARVGQAKLRAMQAAGVPATQKYDAMSFDKAVSDATAKQTQAEVEALQKRQQAVTAERQWDDLQNQLRTTTSAMAR